jgi:hypothetical protein
MSILCLAVYDKTLFCKGVIEEIVQKVKRLIAILNL